MQSAQQPARNFITPKPADHDLSTPVPATRGLTEPGTERIFFFLVCFSADTTAGIMAEQEVENLSGLSTNPEKDIFVVRENGTTCLMAEFAAKFIVPYDVWASNYVDVRNLFPPGLLLGFQGRRASPFKAPGRPGSPAFPLCALQASPECCMGVPACNAFCSPCLL